MTEREFGIDSERGRLRRALSRLRAIVGIAIAQLRHTPMQTVLSVIGIALAVLAVTLLASAGIGVIETGEERFEEADRDLWITGGSVELTREGGLENPIVDAHDVADSVQEREDVESAAPLAFHGVYVENGEDAELITAVGLPGTHADLELEAGDPLTYGDPHYAGGSYDGPRTDELVVDRSTAETLELDVGDTATVATSPNDEGREVTVVGISDTYSQFLGTPTVAMPLSELQQVAGTTGSDRATFVTVSVAEEASVGHVRSEIQSDYPEYELRTNREQLTEMLESRVVVIASATALVALAVLVGAALLLNVLALSIVQRSGAWTALHLVGISRETLGSVIVARGAILGLTGGAIGIVATPVLASVANTIGRWLLGFPNLFRVIDEVLALGGAVAILVTFVGSVLTSVVFLASTDWGQTYH